MADLTLPGDIPGLLRRGSPVVATIGNRDGTRGLYIMPDSERPARACIAVESMPDYGEFLAWPLLSSCALDLTDATGRAHAAWWLAAWWFRTTLETTSTHALRAGWGPLGARWWTCAWPGAALDAGPGGGSRPLELNVPALADLDPDDTRPLPDGSRWVDAEALRLVCLHVAGREVTHG